MREPCVVRMPLVAVRSLIAWGKPCIQPRIFAARKLLVARLGLRNQIAAVLQRDDGVDLGIERARCDRDRRSSPRRRTPASTGSRATARARPSSRCRKAWSCPRKRFRAAAGVTPGVRLRSEARVPGHLAWSSSLPRQLGIYGVHGDNRNPLTCLPARSVMARRGDRAGPEASARKRQAPDPAFWEFRS